MASIYTRRLVGPLALPIVDTPLYTVPTGRVAVVRNVIIVQMAAPTATITLAIGSTAVAANRWMRHQTVADSTALHETRVALDEGESIHGASTTGLVVVTITGYEFA